MGISVHLIAKIGLFGALPISYTGGEPMVRMGLGNSVTLQPSLHCSLTRLKAHFMRRIAGLLAVSANLSF
jgi:hypothetical protein